LANSAIVFAACAPAAYIPSVKTSRQAPPKYPPDPNVLRLRGVGWTVVRISVALGVTLREVYRWSAGDARPRETHRNLLRGLLGESQE
jgi:hypothetical protein